MRIQTLNNKSGKKPVVPCPCGSRRRSFWLFDDPKQPNVGRRVCAACRPDTTPAPLGPPSRRRRDKEK